MKLIQQQVLAATCVFSSILGTISLDAQQIYRPAVRSSAPVLRETTERVDNMFQFRGGPRFGLISGQVRPGLAGSSLLDLHDDLQLTDVGPGFQLDFEMRVAPDWRAKANFSNTTFDGPNVITTKTYTYHSTSNPPANPNTQSNPAVLQPGSTISDAITLNTFSMLLEYELYKDKHWIIGPQLGMKAVYLNQKMVITNVTTSNTIVDSTDIDELTPLLGLSARYQFDKHLYLGIAPLMFGSDQYIYVTGQAYVGYDFDKISWGSFGLRLGVDVDQIWTDHVQEGSSRYEANVTLFAPYLQLVYGF